MNYFLALLFTGLSAFAQKTDPAFKPIICGRGSYSPVAARNLCSSDSLYHPNEVKIMADYKGGIKAFCKFISKTLETGKLDLPSGSKTRLYVSFIIEKDGSLSTIKILRARHKALGEALAKAIAQSPKWIPAVNHKGDAARMLFTLPYMYQNLSNQ